VFAVKENSNCYSYQLSRVQSQYIRNPVNQDCVDKNSSASDWAAYASTGFVNVLNVVNGINH
jgi:hypothetical protein